MGRHGEWRIISASVEDTIEDPTALSEWGPYDAILSDPPYGLKFMGAGWDHGVPPATIWEGLVKHLRPGAGLALFGGTRTWHRLTCAVEDAGLEIRDTIACWTYGTGFPKPGNVGKYIDKRLKRDRQIIGENPNSRAPPARSRELREHGRRDDRLSGHRPGI